MDMRSNCSADLGGVHLGGTNMASARDRVSAPPVAANAAFAQDDPGREPNFTWSNRNGGEIMVTWGSMCMTVSEALARLAHGKLGAALAVPDKAAAMAVSRVIDEAIADGAIKGASDKVRELLREPMPDATITEPLADRRAALCRTVPHRLTRLSAVREAIACCENEGTAAAHICHIPFTPAELADLEATLAIAPVDEVDC